MPPIIESETSLSHSPPPITLYSRPNCPLDPSVISVLESAEVNYMYVDVRFDEEARARLREINAGNESVPTLVFPDGSTLTEPLPHQLRQKLLDAGYELSMLQTWGTYILKNPLYAFVVIMLLVAVLRVLGVF